MAETITTSATQPSEPLTASQACAQYMDYYPTANPWGGMPLPELRAFIHACEPLSGLTPVQAAVHGSMQLDNVFSTYHAFIQESSRGASASTNGRQAMRYAGTQRALLRAADAYALAATDSRPVHSTMATVMSGSLPLYEHLIHGGELNSRAPYDRWRTHYKLALEGLLDQEDAFDPVEELPTLRVIGLLGVMNTLDSEEAFLPLPERYSQTPDPYFRVHALRWSFKRRSYLPVRMANNMLSGQISIQPSILENAASPKGGAIGTLHAVLKHMQAETRQAKRAGKTGGRTGKPKPPTPESRHVHAVRRNIVSGIDNFLVQARQQQEHPELAETSRGTGLEQYRNLTAAEEILLIPDQALEDAIAQLSSLASPSLAERRERAELLLEYGHKLLARGNKTGMDYIASGGQELQELRKTAAAGTPLYYKAWTAFAASSLQAELHNDEISADELEEAHLPGYQEELIAVSEHAMARRSKHIMYEEYDKAKELEEVLHELTALLMLSNVERGTLAHLPPTRCTRGAAGWSVSVVVRQPEGYMPYYFGRLRVGTTAGQDSLEENVLSVSHSDIEPSEAGSARFVTLRTEIARLRGEEIDAEALQKHETIRDSLMQVVFTAEY